MGYVIYGIGGYDPSKPNNNIIEFGEDPVGPSPPTATPATIRIALRRLHGITTDQLNMTVNAVIASIPDSIAREDARDLWNYAITIERSHPLVAAVAVVFGLSEEEVDDVFRVAATI